VTENDAKKAAFHESKEPKTSRKSTSKKQGDQSGVDPDNRHSRQHAS
jgi:hypothetical protein